MNQLQTARQRASNLSTQLRGAQGLTYGSAAMQTATTVAGAFSAGVIDGKVPAVAGQRPSVAAGVALLVGGVMVRSPMAVRFAGGMLAPAAYEAGREVAAPAPVAP